MTRRLGDRRSRPRFEIVGELWGTLHAVVGLPLRNISHGGALVESDITLTPESVHQVTVSCEGQQTPASVRVCHVQRAPPPTAGDRFLIGMEFLSVPPTLRAQIERWMGGGEPAPEVGL